MLEAEQISRRALAAIEARLGPEHPDAAVSLNNLALILGHEGRPAEAEALYLRSIDIMTRTLGVDHPFYGLPNGNLGNLYVDLGRFRDAEPFLKRALETNEKGFRAGTSSCCFRSGRPGLPLSTDGHRGAAEGYYQRALLLGEKLFGPEHRIVVSALSGLADLQMEASNASRAQQLFRRAITLGDKALGPDDPMMQRLHFRLAAHGVCGWGPRNCIAGVRHGYRGGHPPR